MNKTEALEYINNSDGKYFYVRANKKHKCNLCKNEYNDICEFTVSAKHVNGYTVEGLDLDTNGRTRVIKHICTHCFVKLFPDCVINKE